MPETADFLNRFKNPPQTIPVSIQCPFSTRLQCKHPLHRVFQFPDIFRPVLVVHGCDDIRMSPLSLFLQQQIKSSHECVRPQPDVFQWFPYGRNFNGIDIQAIIKHTFM